MLGAFAHNDGAPQLFPKQLEAMHGANCFPPCAPRNDKANVPRKLIDRDLH